MPNPVSGVSPAKFNSHPSVGMYTSDARAEQAAYLLYLVRHKLISSASYKHEKSKLDKREAKSVALAAAKRAAAAAAAAAKRKAKTAALAKAKKAAKVEAMLKKQKVLVVVKLDYQVRKPAKDGKEAGEWVKRTRTLDIETTRGDVVNKVRDFITFTIGMMEEESDIEVAHAQARVVSTSVKGGGLYAGATIKMKAASALDLDGAEVQTWDTGKGRCVFDFIIWRYGKYSRKLCTYEMLEAIIRADDPTSNPLEDGVSAQQCVSIANTLGVRLLAMDEDNNIILTHAPEQIRKDLPPLFFRVKNEHFYALMNAARSLAQIKHTSEMTHFKKDAKEGEVKEKAPMEYRILPETATTRIEQMIDIMKQEKTEVFADRNTYRHMTFTDGELCGFTLKGIKYAWDENDNIRNAMKIAEINGRPYTGETIFSILMDLLERHGLMKHRSTPNPHVYDSLTAVNVKYRTHYGATSDLFTRDQLEALVSSGQAICADIAKCYTAVLEDPMAGWYLFDSKCEWTLWDGKLVPGLYFVETSDMKLLHGTNIYSDTIIAKALSLNIALSIRYQLIPSTILAPGYFKPILNAIHELCKGDKTLKKALTNIITGYLGKTQTTQVMAKLSTDIRTVWNDYTKMEGDAFLRQAENYYVYGEKQVYKQREINVPMYIQVLDQSNIRLYDMIEQSGGELLARKTDCAVILGGSLSYGSENGEYRPSDVPLQMREMTPVAFRHVSESHFETTRWATHSHITSSNQYTDIFQVVVEKGGCLLDARAGTGKTYAALAIEKLWLSKFGEAGKVIKLAFTNMAALNFGGKTFHKFMKMDGKARFNLTWVRSLKSREVLFICDESSMNGSMIWERLVQLKKALPNSRFLLLGDRRQCQPVEDCEAFDYFNSETVKWLAGRQRVELLERQRYDVALWDFAEDVYERGICGLSRSGMPDIETLAKATNISYTNKTRKHINDIVNKWEARGRQVFPAEAGESQYSQPCLLYIGMPIIAHMNFTRGGILQCANSERFTIQSIDAETMVVVCKRQEGEHRMELATADFAKYFLPAYCTTTHKLQGATISGPINIFDWPSMTREIQYTACTRARALSQIRLV